MPTEMPTKKDDEARAPSLPATVGTEQNEVRAAERAYAKRVRRLKVNLVAWVLGAILLTALWVFVEWNANCAFERFAHEGNAATGTRRCGRWLSASGGWWLESWRCACTSSAR